MHGGEGHLGCMQKISQMNKYLDHSDFFCIKLCIKGTCVNIYLCANIRSPRQIFRSQLPTFEFFEIYVKIMSHKNRIAQEVTFQYLPCNKLGQTNYLGRINKFTLRL